MSRYTSVCGKVKFNNAKDFNRYVESILPWLENDRFIGSLKQNIFKDKNVVKFTEGCTDAITGGYDIVKLLEGYNFPMYTVVRYVSDDGELEAGEFSDNTINNRTYSTWDEFCNLFGTSYMESLFTDEYTFDELYDNNIYDGTPLCELRESLYSWQYLNSTGHYHMKHVRSK